MSNLINFNYNTLSVRTVEADDQIWFVAKDIATALEYNSNNMGQLFGSVPDEWKGRNRIATPSGEQDMLCISEQGLYFFLGRSDKPKALPFQKWVAGDVIPSIRKTGKYEAPKSAPKDYKLADLMEGAKIIFDAAGIEGAALALALDSVAVNETGKSMLKAAGLQIAAPKQKVLLCPRDIGAPFGLTPQAVNSILETRGLQHRNANGKWEPTEKGKELGAELLYVNKKQGTGTLVTQLKWPSDILDQSSNL